MLQLQAYAPGFLLGLLTVAGLVAEPGTGRSEEAGEHRDPAPECRHVPSGLSVECRVALIPAGKGAKRPLRQSSSYMTIDPCHTLLTPIPTFGDHPSRPSGQPLCDLFDRCGHGLNPKNISISTSHFKLRHQANSFQAEKCQM